MMKVMAAALLLLTACEAGPDEFQLGYGHGWVGDGSIGQNKGAGLSTEHGDIDFVTIGFAWQLKPREVVIRDIERPRQAPVAYEISPVVERNTQTAPRFRPRDEDERAFAWITKFNSLDFWTRLFAFGAFIWITWHYRASIRQLIPKFGGNKK